MAQQPAPTNVGNREEILAPHSGKQDISIPKHDDIGPKVDGAQQQASDGFNGR